MGALYPYRDGPQHRGREVSERGEVQARPINYAPPGSTRREEYLREREYRADGSVSADRLRVRRYERTDPYVLPAEPRGCVGRIADGCLALIGMVIMVIVVASFQSMMPGLLGAVAAVGVIVALATIGRG